MNIISFSSKDKNKFIIISQVPFKEKDIISELTKDLNCLYPFRFSVKKNKPLNLEDFFFLKEKYNLQLIFKLNGFENHEQKKLTFNTPFLYYKNNILLPPVLKPLYKEKKKGRVCLIFPEKNILTRTKILNEAIFLGAEIFVNIGEKKGKNKESTSTLMTRYLLGCNIALENIIKINIETLPDCIFETLQILELLDKKENLEFFIACSKTQIQVISKTIRKLRKKGELQIRFRYIC